MRLKHQFADHNRKLKHPFKENSTYMPNTSESVVLENYLYSIRIELESLTSSLSEGPLVKQNMSVRQKSALKSLAKRKDIVIYKADKGSMTIIRSRHDICHGG